MQTKFKIIETEQYRLAVSDEEVKEGEELIPNKWYINSYRGYDKPFKNHNLDNNGYLKQVISHQPKNNAPELDLPLLPEMVVEDNVEKLAENYINMLIKEGWDLLIPQHAESFIQGMKMGIKSTTKTYTEDDLRKAFEAGNKRGWSGYPDTDNWTQPKFEEFIQSLKQPKWFVAKTEDIFHSPSPIGMSVDTVLKTTTINGKTYLVGKYLNE